MDGEEDRKDHSQVLIIETPRPRGSMNKRRESLN